MAPDTAHTVDRPLGTDHGGAGIPLISSCCRGRCASTRRSGGPPTEPARDD